MSSQTGFVYNDRFLDHDTGAGHPERPERLAAVVNHLHSVGLWKNLQHLIIDRATEEQLVAVHRPRLVKFVREACERGIEVIDQGDTHVCSESYDIALLAAGGLLAGVDAVMSGILANVFCAIRPPGHHAERDASMGFCLFNNVAVATRYAQKKYGVERIAIIDWDVHHGNGTQDIFYDDPTVLYISTHQSPFYPGTGTRAERGTGRGEGFTLNLPMRAGSGEKEYLEAFQKEILPALHFFRPDLVMISAGFDAHKDDPLAHIKLTEATFARMTRLVMEIADAYCHGRIISALEGGYNFEGLSRSVEAHLRELLR